MPGVLKDKSSFAKSSEFEGVRERKIVFADEKGSVLTEDVFVEQLHYGSNAPVESPKPCPCCVIS